jgi:hypothetical protein
MQTEHIDSESEAPANLEPQTLNLKPRHRRCRNGKIARLPRAIREAVNVMLLDGFLYRDIAAKLEEAGYPGIRLQHLSQWFKGGYEDWLQRRNELETLEHDRKALVALAKDPAAVLSLNEANEVLLTLRVNRTLMDDGAHALPQFLKVADLVNRQFRERNRRDRLAFQNRCRADCTPSNAQSESIPPNPPH